VSCSRRRSARLTRLAALGLLALTACAPRSPEEPGPPVTIEPTDRVLILAPHPDDEVLGCGGVIEKAVALGVPVRVCFLTYGDANEWAFAVYRKMFIVGPKPFRHMGEVRRGEAVAACEALGLEKDALTFLGYPDAGTLAIWREHWGPRPPLRSFSTLADAVPYPDALRPGAPYKGEEILRDLTAVVSDFRPTKIFLSHPLDQNPDHEALYLFTKIVLWDLQQDIDPEVLPFLVHVRRWPTPRGYHPRLPLNAPAPLQRGETWRPLPVAPEAVAAKKDALEEHRTEMEYAGHLLLSFVRTNELFGDLPAVAAVPGEAPSVLSGPGVGRPEAVAPLTESERARLVGIERRSVSVEGRDLVVRVDFTRRLGEDVTAEFWFYGYSPGVPFSRMPKLSVAVDPVGHRVFDQRRRLPRETVRVEREAHGVLLRVPLSVLGDPERLMTGARTRLLDVPLDAAVWRVIDLPGAS
jgi:LmbE family N-acetylglucosaminyl deacetylase